jgi:hypothetical protein
MGGTVLVHCTEKPFWATMTQLSGERTGIAGGARINFGSTISYAWPIRGNVS